MLQGITVAQYEQAEAQVRAEEGRRGFYIHAAIYVVVNIALIAINLLLVPSFLWFFFPLVGWGIGLTMHYLFAVRFEQRETKEYQAKVEQRAQAMQTR